MYITLANCSYTWWGHFCVIVPSGLGWAGLVGLCSKAWYISRISCVGSCPGISPLPTYAPNLNHLGQTSLVSTLETQIVQMARILLIATLQMAVALALAYSQTVVLQGYQIYRPEAGSRFRFQGKMCSVPRFQRCQTCQFLVPALGHPLANMSHAGSSKFITKCRVLN